MSSYLAYSYSCNLTTKERDEIDLKTKKSRKEFSRGFSTGITLSVAAYSVYSLFPPAPAPNSPNQVAPTRPGFKPLSDGSRGAFIDVVSTIYATAAQSRDFLLGLARAGLLVIRGIVINRPHPSKSK